MGKGATKKAKKAADYLKNYSGFRLSKALPKSARHRFLSISATKKAKKAKKAADHLKGFRL